MQIAANSSVPVRSKIHDSDTAAIDEGGENNRFAGCPGESENFANEYNGIDIFDERHTEDEDVLRQQKLVSSVYGEERNADKLNVNKIDISSELFVTRIGPDCGSLANHPGQLGINLVNSKIEPHQTGDYSVENPRAIDSEDWVTPPKHFIDEVSVGDIVHGSDREIQRESVNLPNPSSYFPPELSQTGTHLYQEFNNLQNPSMCLEVQDNSIANDVKYLANATDINSFPKLNESISNLKAISGEPSTEDGIEWNAQLEKNSEAISPRFGSKSPDLKMSGLDDFSSTLPQKLSPKKPLADPIDESASVTYQKRNLPSLLVSRLPMEISHRKDFSSAERGEFGNKDNTLSGNVEENISRRSSHPQERKYPLDTTPDTTIPVVQKDAKTLSLAQDKNGDALQHALRSEVMLPAGENLSTISGVDESSKTKKNGVFPPDWKFQRHGFSQSVGKVAVISPVKLAPSPKKFQTGAMQPVESRSLDRSVTSGYVTDTDPFKYRIDSSDLDRGGQFQTESTKSSLSAIKIEHVQNHRFTEPSLDGTMSSTVKRNNSFERVETQYAASNVSLCTDHLPNTAFGKKPETFERLSFDAQQPKRTIQSTSTVVKPTSVPVGLFMDEPSLPKQDLEIYTPARQENARASLPPATDRLPTSDPLLSAAPIPKDLQPLRAGVAPNLLPDPEPLSVREVEADLVSTLRLDSIATMSASRTVASLGQQPPTTLLQQITDTIRSEQAGTIDLRLEPEELGRLRIQIRAGEAGMIVQILGDRSETIDLLRRHGSALERVFSDQGLDLESFSFGSGHDQQQTEHVSRDGLHDGLGSSAATPGALQPISSSEGAVSAGLDLRL